MTLLATLIARDLRADPADLHWPDRDRLLLTSPAANAAMATPPSGQWLDAPPGLAFGVAVGHAVAERLLAARFGRSLVDHRTWLVASRAGLVCGAGREAAHIAGALGLGRLAVLASLPHDDKVLRAGFVAAGWIVRAIDAHDTHAAEAALSACLRAHKPTLILSIGAASSPDLHPTSRPDDRPLDTPRAHAPPAHAQPDFAPPDVAPPDCATPDCATPNCVPRDTPPVPNPRGAAARRAWLKRLRRHANREAFQHALAGHLPPGWQKACHPTAPSQAPQSATAELIAALTRLVPILPELATLPLSSAPLLPPPHIAAFPAGALDWNALDQAAPACLLGMAMHGGILPVSQTAGTVELPRAVWRLAAHQRARWLHTITRDRPAPPLPELAIANLHVYQPADAAEALDCLVLALRRAEGPSVMSLPPDPPARPPPSNPSLNDAGPNDAHPSAPRQAHPRPDPRLTNAHLAPPHLGAPRLCSRGAYLVHAQPNRDLTLLASGPALVTAVKVRALLAEHGLNAALVSMPCRALWDAQDAAYRHAVLGSAPIVAFAANALAFAGLTGPNDLIIGGQPVGDQSGGDKLGGDQSWPPGPQATVTAILRHRRDA